MLETTDGPWTVVFFREPGIEVHRRGPIEDAGDALSALAYGLAKRGYGHRAELYSASGTRWRDVRYAAGHGPEKAWREAAQIRNVLESTTYQTRLDL